MDQELVVDNRIERRRKRRRGIVALLAAVSMLTIGAGSISLAQFTANAQSTWNFTAGTIDISVNPTAFAAINPMMPGDVNTQALTVHNGGTAQLRYSMSTVATNALGTAIQLTVKTEDTGGGCGAFNGTTIAGPANLNGSAFGSVTQGAQAGDRDLDAGTSEILCFRVSLPLSALDSLQGATSAATFTFNAEQTANNP
jgi:spore coat-associated protein N